MFSILDYSQIHYTRFKKCSIWFLNEWVPTKLKTLQQNSVQQYVCEENKARCVSMLWPKTPRPTPPRCLWGHRWSHSWACWAVRPRWRGTLWTGSWGTVRTVRCPPLPCSYCSTATRTTWWLLLSSWSSWPCRCSAPQTERQFDGRSCRTRCTGGPPWRSAGRPDQTGGGWCGCRRAPGSLPALRSSGSSSGRRRHPQWPSSGRLETRRECRWRRGFGRSHYLSHCPGWVEAVWLRWSRVCSWQSSSRPGGCRRQTWGCSCTPVGWCFSHTTLSRGRSCGEQAHFDEGWVRICGQFEEKNKEKHGINNTFWLIEFAKLWIRPPLQTELSQQLQDGLLFHSVQEFQALAGWSLQVWWWPNFDPVPGRRIMHNVWISIFQGFKLVIDLFLFNLFWSRCWLHSVMAEEKMSSSVNRSAPSFVLLFSQPPGSISRGKIKDEFQHKGNTSAIVQPKQTEALIFPVAIPR